MLTLTKSFSLSYPSPSKEKYKIQSNSGSKKSVELDKHNPDQDCDELIGKQTQKAEEELNKNPSRRPKSAENKKIKVSKRKV